MSEMDRAGPILLGNRYELGERIGSGGFADVYQARQLSTGQSVAVKLFRLARDNERTSRERRLFRREAELCGLLHHPNIVALIDFGEEDDTDYAVFELVKGNNLADVLAAEGSLSPAEALHLLGQVLDAVACAHGAGVVHRDLKPSNIMVTDTGARRNALVLDFGLGAFANQTPPASRFLPAEYMGTPSYSAPEQLRGQHATPASDLFSWALILLESLTGEPSIHGSPAEIVHSRLSPEPILVPAPLAEHRLGRLLVDATRKDPSLRISSAKRLLTMLGAVEEETVPVIQAPRGMAQAEDAVSRVRRSEGALSRLWSVPVRRNPNFTGRESKIEELSSLLERSSLTAIVALHGLGGVGKTQLAGEYAYRNGSRYELVAWLRAEKPETLTEDFASLSELLDLPEQSAPDQRRKVKSVLAWLERNDDWLLIFDNAPNPETIRPFLPRSVAGRVLVTSRHQSWRELGASVEVEELAPEESIEFLVRRTGETDHQAAGELAAELGHLPLALEGAAAYIESTGRPIQAYLELLRTHQDLVLAGTQALDYPQTLGGTWEISFQQLEEEVPEAALLLRVCAFLGPDDIPLDLFRTGAGNVPPELAKALANPVDFDRCLAALRRFSLVKVEGDGLSIHRLVQLVTRERMTGSERVGWAQVALRMAEASFPSSGLAGDWGKGAGRYLPHALVALSHGEDVDASAECAARLLNRTGNYLSARGYHDQAVSYLERSLSLLEGTIGGPDSYVATVHSDLGLILFALGNAEVGRESIERALSIHERLEAEDLIAVDLMYLAYLLIHLGDAETARLYSDRAVEIVRRQFGELHPLEAQGLSTFARALWACGRFDEARAAAERSLSIVKSKGLHHPLMCNCWYSLGLFHLDLGALDVAEECTKLSLEIGERAYGTDHPLVALSFIARGTIQDLQGDLAGARASFERALRSGERTCTRLHGEIAIGRSRLADVLRRSGEHAEAAALLRRSRAGLDRICGDRARVESHLDAATAALLADQGQARDAWTYAEDALERTEQRYGSDHPYLVPMLNLLGSLAERGGASSNLLAQAERALAIGEQTLGGQHHDLAESHRLLGRAAEARGDEASRDEHDRVARKMGLHPGPKPLAPARAGGSA